MTAKIICNLFYCYYNWYTSPLWCFCLKAQKFQVKSFLKLVNTAACCMMPTNFIISTSNLYFFGRNSKIVPANWLLFVACSVSCMYLILWDSIFPWLLQILLSMIQETEVFIKINFSYAVTPTSSFHACSIGASILYFW